MLSILFSNRFDSLLDVLTEQTAQRRANPLEPLHVVIPSVAIRRRVELGMADRLGVCANLHAPFLAEWLWEQMGKVIDVPVESPVASGSLTWRIVEVLRDASFTRAHPRLASYLRTADDVMGYELACSIASLFEQYLTYRPDWIHTWQRGELLSLPGATRTVLDDQAWQQALWQRIANELGISHRSPARQMIDRMASLDHAQARQRGLPDGVHVFCLPSIAPQHLEILRALGQVMSVQVYMLNPCREYWFDIDDPRRLSYLVLQNKHAHRETGHRLLAAWGRQTQAAVEMLLDDGAPVQVEDALFVRTADAGMLAQLQNAILELNEMKPGSLTLDVTDRSLEVHVCHTLSRELEVLHDALLALFSADPSLKPSDILVVTPHLDDAAPAIDAVFGGVPRERRIPYQISGLPRSTDNPVARCLLDVLALAGSRYAMGSVMALLKQPIVAAKFGIRQSELDMIQQWLSESGVRWGIDAMHRTEFEVPAMQRHSFRDGLDRLFLGYALPRSLQHAFQQRIAVCHPEGSDAKTLGCLLRFFDQVQQLRDHARRPYAIARWEQLLYSLLDDFCAMDRETVGAVAEVRQVIARLATDMRAGGVQSAITLDVVRAALQRLLDDPTQAGQPGGSLTFTSMAALRNVPYAVVCMIGMNDGGYPGAARTLEFDLCTASPRPGDRQRKLDERNVFLDLLLSAKKKLYISYTGRSVRDNAPMPPSVLVSDLLDCVASAAARDGRTVQQVMAQLVTPHPLQPFSPRYFIEQPGRRLHSFNAEYCEALNRRRLQLTTIVPDATFLQHQDAVDIDDTSELVGPFFGKARLPEVEAAWRTVTLDQLLEFYRNPCRFLLRHRLGIAMPERNEEQEEHEPVLPSPWCHTKLAERLLPHLLDGAAEDEVLALAMAGLEYPYGPVGEVALQSELAALARFATTLTTKRGGNASAPRSHVLEFKIDSVSWWLDGAVSNLHPGGLVHHRYGDLRANDYLECWIRHLFLHAVTACLHSAHHVGRDDGFSLKQCTQAKELLRHLLEMYAQGLHEPLHFFPKSAWAYMEKGRSLSAAEGAWRSSIFTPHKEDSDAAYRLAMRGRAALDETFETAAQRIFGPLRDHLC